VATRRGVLVLFLVLFVDLFHFVDLCFFLSVSLYLYSIYNSLTEEREGGRDGGRGAGVCYHTSAAAWSWIGIEEDRMEEDGIGSDRRGRSAL
jgi:hypothetical protein